MKINKMLTLVFSIVFLSWLNCTVFAAGGGGVIKTDPTKHFDPKGKMPSKFTIELQNGLRKPYDQLKNMLVQFSMGFEILPGTKPVETAASAKNPFKQEPPAVNTITD
ncbi:MAG: hypothetical protein HQ552_14945 [Desulfobacteraceae bacterium]|nr:hypothetical protein [Desulfobacteraceae bacterium]